MGTKASEDLSNCSISPLRNLARRIKRGTGMKQDMDKGTIGFT